jgi:hypothetical protein
MKKPMWYKSVLVVLIIFLFVAGGCASRPPVAVKYSWELYLAPKVSGETFKGQSVAILPPLSIEYLPSQEVYRETLAGLLYKAMREYPESPTIIAMDAVQSAINRNELWNDVLRMYTDYHDSAVLRKDVLSKLGQAVDARYVLLPKLLSFQQEVFDRATFLGVSFLRTRLSLVSVQAQIWDTVTGEVVWQGVGEGTDASEVVRGRPASFASVARNASESLASRMPWVK